MTTSPAAPRPTTAGAVERASRWPAWLLCLTLASFAAGTDNFVIAGVLRQIAAGLHVSVAVAGQLITVFAFTYTIAAPLVAVWTARLPRRAVLLVTLAVFVVSNVCASVAPSYQVLVVFRGLTAVAAATLMPGAYATAARLAPAGSTGKFLGTVTFGQSVALVAGVPIGTAISGAFGWRATMLFVAALGLVAMVGIRVFMDRQPGTPAIPLRRRLSPLRRGPVVLGLLGTVVGAAGNFMTYSYIAPITHSLAHSGPGQLAVLVSVMGLASAAGAILGGRAADAWGASRTIVLALSAQVLSTALLPLCGQVSEAVAVVLVGLLLAGWGIFGGALNPPLQARLLALAGDAGSEVVALNSSCLYLGISVSGGLGGVVLASWGAASVPIAAAVLGAASVGVLAWSSYGPAGRRATSDAAAGRG